VTRPLEPRGKRADRVLEARGGDARLAAMVELHRGADLRFVPDATSDLARALGVSPDGGVRTPTTLDVLRLDPGGVAVNMVVQGLAPDRRRPVLRRPRCRVEVDGRVAWDAPATTVVVANGEYLRGLDVVPRGHPGDGRLEVQVYEVGARQRRLLRARLATGTHLPHPDVRSTQGTTVSVRWERPVRQEVDGTRRGRVAALSVTLVPGGVTLVP
jgi:hypothetical protein